MAELYKRQHWLENFGLNFVVYYLAGLLTEWSTAMVGEECKRKFWVSQTP